MLLYKNEKKQLDLAKIIIEIPLNKLSNEDFPTDFICRVKQEKGYDKVKFIVDSNTGKILNEGFPKNLNLYIKQKVKDRGIYTLLDSNDNELFKIEDYVPDFLPNEYGDYIELQIENGFITNWIKHENIYLENYIED